MQLTKYRNRIPEIYGSFIAAGLIVYFLISYFGGFVHLVELRLLNLAIMIAGIYFALRQHKQTHEGHINYFKALVIGVATGAIGTATFVLFLFFMFKIDNALYQSVVKNTPLGPYVNAYLATFAVFIEGIFSGFMATFILINFMDTDKD